LRFPSRAAPYVRERSLEDENEQQNDEDDREQRSDPDVHAFLLGLATVATNGSRGAGRINQV
jgi:hypothetical protein